MTKKKKELCGKSLRDQRTSFEAAVFRTLKASAPLPFKQKKLIIFSPNGGEERKLLDGAAPTLARRREADAPGQFLIFSGPEYREARHRSDGSQRVATNKHTLRVLSSFTHLWQPARISLSSRRKGRRRRMTEWAPVMSATIRRLCEDWDKG